MDNAAAPSQSRGPPLGFLAWRRLAPLPQFTHQRRALLTTPCHGGEAAERFLARAFEPCWLSDPRGRPRARTKHRACPMHATPRQSCGPRTHLFPRQGTAPRHEDRPLGTFTREVLDTGTRVAEQILPFRPGFPRDPSDTGEHVFGKPTGPAQWQRPADIAGTAPGPFPQALHEHAPQGLPLEGIPSPAAHLTLGRAAKCPAKPPRSSAGSSQ